VHACCCGGRRGAHPNGCPHRRREDSHTCSALSSTWYTTKVNLAPISRVVTSIALLPPLAIADFSASSCSSTACVDPSEIDMPESEKNDIDSTPLSRARGGGTRRRGLGRRGGVEGVFRVVPIAARRGQKAV